MQHVALQALFAASLSFFGLAAHGQTFSGTVTIGEGTSQIATGVPNRSSGGKCLNALIEDTVSEGASYDSNGEFVAEVAKLGVGWVSNGVLS
jgi:hypothetical protein